MFNFDSFGGLAGIGILTAGIGFAYAQFRSGSNQAKDDLIKTLKEAAEVERTRAMRLAQERETLVRSHQEQINELTKQLGILQGKAEANDKKMKEYLDIFQGRSPEQAKFMEYITRIAQESAKYMGESSVILSQTKDFMSEMNNEIKKGSVFNKQVAEDTAKGEGNVLRKK